MRFLRLQSYSEMQDEVLAGILRPASSASRSEHSTDA